MAVSLLASLSFDDPAGPLAEYQSGLVVDGGSNSLDKIDQVAGKGLELTMSVGPIGGFSFGPRWRGRIEDLHGLASATQRRIAQRYVLEFPEEFTFGKDLLVNPSAGGSSGKVGGWMCWDGSDSQPGGGEPAGWIGTHGTSQRLMYKQSSNTQIKQNSVGRRVTWTPYLYVPGLAQWDGSKYRGSWFWMDDPLTNESYRIQPNTRLVVMQVAYIPAYPAKGWWEFWVEEPDLGLPLRRLYVGDSQWAAEVTGNDDIERPDLSPTRVTSGPLKGRLENVAWTSSAGFDPGQEIHEQMSFFQGGGDSEMTGGSYYLHGMDWFAFESSDDSEPAIWPSIDGDPPPDPPPASSHFVTEGQISSLVTAVAAQAADTPTYVYHGGTAGTARPSVSGPVIWVGTVSPTNGIAGLDFWINTT